MKRRAFLQFAAKTGLLAALPGAASTVLMDAPGPNKLDILDVREMGRAIPTLSLTDWMQLKYSMSFLIRDAVNSLSGDTVFEIRGNAPSLYDGRVPLIAWYYNTFMQLPSYPTQSFSRRPVWVPEMGIYSYGHLRT